MEMPHSSSDCVSQHDLQRLHDRTLSDREVAALLSKIGDCVFCKRRWMLFRPAGSKPEVPPPGPDFIERLESEIDEKILKVAERLLEINWINPNVSRQVINEIFQDFPRPDDLGKRILEKCKELHSKKKATC